MLGQANQIDYIETMSLLELRGSARFSYVGDVIESDLIHINTENNGIQACGSESNQRVKMLIQPKVKIQNSLNNALINHTNLLEATELAKAYKKREVVKSVSLHIAGGEIVGLPGPNGVGKTTC